MRIAYLLIALAGCVETSVVQCADGRTCPAGTQCHATYALCISTEQQTACATLADGDACMADDVGGECFDGLCIKPLCGDGLVTSDERCDGENVDGATCVDLAWYEGELTCDPRCRFVETACNGRCGDGVVNGAESCDGVGTRPAYSTCLTFGFDAGELGCSTACEPGLDECARLYWLATELQMEAYSIHGDGDLLLAVGEAGEIRRFGVLGWTLMPSGTTIDLDDVFVADSANAWVVGKGGLILHFDGMTWSQVASSTTADLRGVWAASPTDAFAVGAGGVILHWNGTAWSAMTSPTSLDLEDIWGFSGSDVHVAGTGQALRYNGTAWSINGGFPTTQHAIWGAAPNDVWMGGGYGDQNGDLYHWNGTTWTTETIAGMGDVVSIWGTSSDNVYFAPYLHGLYHWNGESLTKFVAPVFFVRALGGRGPDELFASTFAGLSRWEGHGWNLAAQRDGNFTAVSGTAVDDFYAFGGAASEHWDGFTWTAIPSLATSGGFSQAAFTSNGTGLVVGSASGPSPIAFVHLPQDAPTTWTATSTAGLCSGCNLLSVAAVGTEFIVGSSQGLYRFTPGASTPWAAIPGGPTATIRSVTAFSPTDVYFMTTESTIYHYDGLNLANLAWPGPTLPATPLRDMVATGTGAARTVFGVAGGAVYRHTAGAWTDITPSEVLVPSFGVPPMPRFFAFAPDDVFLVGQTPSGTTILHWNGGVWSRVRSNAMLANAVWGPSSRYLAVVGDGAHLLDRTVAW